MIRRQFLSSIILALLFSVVSFAKVELLTSAVMDLRPTQSTLGFSEIEKKAKKIEKKQKAGELENYLRREAVPVVLGLNKQKYMIDGHHFLAAAHKQKIDKVYYEIVDDLSNMPSEAGFWSKMIETKRVYLKKNGQPIQPKDLPNDISGLVDDPYRAFAAKVRDAGGFEKEDIPFVEFMWADYFRDLIPLDLITNDKRAALRQAKILARDSKASLLPGFKGSKP